MKKTRWKLRKEVEEKLRFMDRFFTNDSRVKVWRKFGSMIMYSVDKPTQVFIEEYSLRTVPINILKESVRHLNEKTKVEVTERV